MIPSSVRVIRLKLNDSENVLYQDIQVKNQVTEL